MRICAVTYTHNDTELAHGLLRLLLRQSVPINDLIVVDDGSEPAYAFPQDVMTLAGKSRLQIIRQPRNQGPVQAKRTGLDAAVASGAEVILSLDADIRPHKDWLAKALPWLTDRTIGLVGAEFAHGLAGDYLSQYFNDLFPKEQSDKQTPFLGAGLWLLRSHVWQDLGGFGDFNQRTHEDLYFCRKVSAAGLGMLSLNSKPVRQVRRLNRRDYARRDAAYLGRAVLKAAQKHGLDAALQPLERLSGLRLEKILALNNPVYLYLEIFLHSAFLAWLHEHAPGNSQEAALAEKKLRRQFALLQGYPNARSLLVQDLSAVGLKAVDAFEQNPAVLGQIPRLEQPGLHQLLLKLEFCGIRSLNREDREMSFSAHYLARESG